MGNEIVKFFVDALKKDDFLSKTWNESQSIRRETAIGVALVVALLVLAPSLLADWYRQSLFSINKPIGWLWGFWGLLPLSAFAVHAANAVADINRHYHRRFEQSKLLTRGGWGDDIFAKLMSEYDVQRKYAPGAPEESLIRAIVDAFFATATASLVFCPVILAPAAVLTAFVPELFVPAVAITFSLVALVYMAIYARQSRLIASYHIFVNIPIFAVFIKDGLVASMSTYLAIHLLGALGGYIMSKLLWAHYNSRQA